MVAVNLGSDTSLQGRGLHGFAPLAVGRIKLDHYRFRTVTAMGFRSSHWLFGAIRRRGINTETDVARRRSDDRRQHACSASIRQRCRGYCSGPKIGSLTVLSVPLLPKPQNPFDVRSRSTSSAMPPNEVRDPVQLTLFHVTRHASVDS